MGARMGFLHPPHLAAALDHLRQSLAAVGEAKLDPEQASWADLEKGVIKVLGGPFSEAKDAHQLVALGLAVALATRIARDNTAFWFPNREAPEGASLGFAEALIFFSPYAAVADALSKARLTLLEEPETQIRRAIAQSKFAPQAAAAPVRLTALDYQRLFDPAFVQIILLDLQKAKKTWSSTPEQLTRDLRDGIARIGDSVPAAAKAQLEGQLVGALARLELGKPIQTQTEHAPRMLEMLAHLTATVEGSGAAPEEFWADIVFPIAFIGAPEQFPPIEGEEKKAIQEGADRLSLWVDWVPYQVSAPEEGFLGAFDPSTIKLPLPELAASGAPRLLEVSGASLEKALEHFDPDAVRRALKRFGEQIAQHAGPKAATSQESDEMLDAALKLLGDVKSLMAQKAPEKVICIRRITEAEAASESTLILLRKALSGPRLILTSR